MLTMMLRQIQQWPATVPSVSAVVNRAHAYQHAFKFESAPPHNVLTDNRASTTSDQEDAPRSHMDGQMLPRVIVIVSSTGS